MTKRQKKNDLRHGWAVWRQDDNGHRFLICVKETREEAESILKAYEELGHKQYYFLEFSSQDNRPATGEG